MPSPKTIEFRKTVDQKRADWRYCKSFHRRLFIILGIASSASATFVAANSKFEILNAKYAWIVAAFAAVLTFVVAGLGAQSQANSFESGERLLEEALALYDSDDEYGDKELELEWGKAEADPALNLHAVGRCGSRHCLTVRTWDHGRHFAQSFQTCRSDSQ